MRGVFGPNGNGLDEHPINLISWDQDRMVLSTLWLPDIIKVEDDAMVFSTRIDLVTDYWMVLVGGLSQSPLAK